MQERSEMAESKTTEEEMSEAREIVDALFAMGSGLTMHDRYRYLADCLLHRDIGRHIKAPSSQ